MTRPLKLLSLIFIVIVVLAGLGLSSCSAGTSSQTSSPAVEQPSSAPSSSGNGQSTAPAAQQQGNPSSGQRGTRGQGGQGGQNMSAVLNKAADILGISESTFTSAFNDAQKSVIGSQPSGNGGQPPRPPSGNDNWSGRGSQLPPGGSGGQPPSGNGGGRQGGSDMMTKVYAQMATALNISADQISAAMQQAFTAVGNQTGSSQ